MKTSSNPITDSGVHVRTAIHVFEDASGAPAVLECDGYVFACDCIGTEIKLNLIAPVSGSRVRNMKAADRVRRAYAQLLGHSVDGDWIDRNWAMYKVQSGVEVA